jgi:hypothetical protein
MNAQPLEVKRSRLPMLVKIIGERGDYVLFILKTGGRKLGAQLIKPDRSTLQLLEQH